VQVLPLARCCRGGVQEEDIVVLCRRNMPWIRGTGRTGRCSSPEIEGQRRLLRSMSMRRIDPPLKSRASRTKKQQGRQLQSPSTSVSIRIDPLGAGETTAHDELGVASLLFSGVLRLDADETTLLFPKF